jgi:hypothetical protein
VPPHSRKSCPEQTPGSGGGNVTCWTVAARAAELTNRVGPRYALTRAMSRNQPLSTRDVLAPQRPKDGVCLSFGASQRFRRNGPVRGGLVALLISLPFWVSLWLMLP